MIEIAFRDFIASDTTVVAVVGTRVYPSLAPPQAKRPFLVYTIVDGVPDQEMSAQSTLGHARIQVDCYADTYQSVAELSNDLRLACNGYRGNMGDVEDVKVRLVDRIVGIGNPQAGKGKGIHRITLDFELTFQSVVPTF